MMKLVFLLFFNGKEFWVVCEVFVFIVRCFRRIRFKFWGCEKSMTKIPLLINFRLWSDVIRLKLEPKFFFQHDNVRILWSIDSRYIVIYKERSWAEMAQAWGHRGLLVDQSLLAEQKLKNRLKGCRYWGEFGRQLVD